MGARSRRMGPSVQYAILVTAPPGDRAGQCELPNLPAVGSRSPITLLAMDRKAEKALMAELLRLQEELVKLQQWVRDPVAAPRDCRRGPRTRPARAG